MQSKPLPPAETATAPESAEPVAPETSGPESGDLDEVWRALSNPIRRRILDLLMERHRTTGELVDAFPELSRFAVMQHLKVLEAGGLLAIVREGRVRHNYINPVPIQQIYDRWVSRYMQPWTTALTGLKRTLEEREESA